MNILNEILGAQGGDALGSLATQFGLGSDQAKSALGQLLPSLSAGMKQNIQSEDGLTGLLGALTKGDHQRYLDQPDTLNTDSARKDGNAILGHLLGSKDVSRKVAGQAAEKTGIDVSILKKMLPEVAGLFMGAISKQSSQLGLQGAAANPQAGSMLSKFLDADGDGSVADDLLGMAKKLF